MQASCSTARDFEALPAIIVVILPEVLVARDIEMTLWDLRPEAHVLLARTLHEAEEALPPGRIELTFVQLDPARFAASALGRRSAADGGKVVVLCEDRRNGLPDDWFALPVPFASDALALLLSGLV
jgi:hypothetical protein